MINNIILEKYRQASKEINNELKRGRFRLLPTLEKAFIDWYLEAKFGSTGDKKITDGKKDGGIDAIVDTGDSIYVFQSKYEATQKVALITRDELSSFENLARKFLIPQLQEEFKNWLTTIRPELKVVYERIYDVLHKKNKQVRFVFCTNKRADFSDTELFEIDDIQNISALWYLYSEGFTPPIDHIELKLENSWLTPSNNGGFNTYVGLTDINHFRQLMKSDINERLFAQNVRTDLKSKINENICQTYEEEPDIFWLCNNGIYIVCKKVQITGSCFTLTYPSIINGSQTLHAISKSVKNHSCKILVRILEMDITSDTRLLNSVVRRTNTQNTMKPINLYSLDTAQLNIARFLTGFHIFYERREKEWINEAKIMFSEYIPVNIGDVAQWISTKIESIGLGHARNKISSLFEDSTYQKIFGDFGNDYRTTQYIDLYCLIWAGLVVDILPKHLPIRYRPFAKISRLLLVKILYISIKQSNIVIAIIKDLLMDHKYGKKELPNQFVKVMNMIIKTSIELQQREQEKDPKMDYTNFFKRDEYINIVFREICKDEIINQISISIEKYSKKFK